MTLSMMTLSIMTLSMMTLIKMTLSKMTLIKMILIKMFYGRGLNHWLNVTRSKSVWLTEILSTQFGKGLIKHGTAHLYVIQK